MIKKLLIVGGLTGAAHFITLISLKIISKNVLEENIALIGEVDSLLLLLISIVSFGIQLSTTRDIALAKNWKDIYYSSQSARFTLSLFIILFSLLGFIITKYWLLLAAPILALNGDYALYGRNMAEKGAFVAFLRVLLPSLTLIYFSFYNEKYIVIGFSISLVTAYLLAGLLVSRFLQTRYFVKPGITYLKKFLVDFKIGVAGIALFFVGIGIINIVSYFYIESVMAVAYVALKLYMIFKGVRRIIVQSFFKELAKAKVTLQIDYISTVAAIVFLFSILLFPQTVISIMFDEKYLADTSIFIILGIAAFISSFTTSSGTRLLLLKEDNKYVINLVVAALVTILSGVLFSFIFKDRAMYIGIAILLGELCISVLNIISLKEKDFIKNRVKQVFIPFSLILVVASIRYIFEDSLLIFVTSFAIYGIGIFFVSRKELT